MGDTEIEWASKVWNFVRGCRRVSPGCGGPAGVGGCYAEAIAGRFSGPGLPYEGLATIGKNGARWTGKGRFVPEKLAEPLSWRPPKDGSRHRVFVNSMSDLFFEEFSNEEIAAGFGVMAACPQHDFLILTKRADRMRDWCRWAEEQGQELLGQVNETPPGGSPVPGACAILANLRQPLEIIHGDAWRAAMKAPWPLPNVWIGVSCEDQQRADERIPLLLETPAAVRFVSAEPLLGAVDLEEWLTSLGAETCSYGAAHEAKTCECRQTALDWVIVGGESGPGSRPFDVGWARSIVAQCKAAGTAVFVKQFGANVRWDGVTTSPETAWPPGRSEVDSRLVDVGGAWQRLLDDKKGGDMEEWPRDLRVRDFPTTECR